MVARRCLATLVCAVVLLFVPSTVFAGNTGKNAPTEEDTAPSLPHLGPRACPFPSPTYGTERAAELAPYTEGFMDLMLGSGEVTITALTSDLNTRMLRLLEDVFDFKDDFVINRALVNFHHPGAPASSDSITVRGFLVRIAECASQNDYLLKALRQMYTNRAMYYADKGMAEKANQLKDSVAYTRVLDVLTRAVRLDTSLILSYKNVFFEKYKRELIDKQHPTTMFAPLNPIRRFIKERMLKNSIAPGDLMNAFEKVKILGVEQGLVGIHRRLTDNEVEPGLYSTAVSVNILEAIAEDYRLKNNDNGDSALPMTSNGPNEVINAFMGAGPATISDDGKAFGLYPNLPKQWSDLYSTWNMAFVSHYTNAPMFWAKLFNPQVLCYEDHPEEYMYNRVISLWLHINYEFFTRITRGQRETPDRWNDQHVTNTWSTINKNAGKTYIEAVEHCIEENQSEYVLPIGLKNVHRVENMVEDFRKRSVQNSALQSQNAWGHMQTELNLRGKINAEVPDLQETVVAGNSESSDDSDVPESDVPASASLMCGENIDLNDPLCSDDWVGSGGMDFWEDYHAPWDGNEDDEASFMPAKNGANYQAGLWSEFTAGSRSDNSVAEQAALDDAAEAEAVEWKKTNARLRTYSRAGKIGAEGPTLAAH